MSESLSPRVGQLSQLLLQKAKEVSNLELSDFRFFREMQEALIYYLQDVIRGMMWGVAGKLGVDPSSFEKSVSMTEEELMKGLEDPRQVPDLLKGLLDDIRRQFEPVRKYYEKFKFAGNSRVTPLRIKGRTLTNPETGKPLTVGEWQDIEDSITDYLGEYLGGMEEETVVRAGLLGLLRRRMQSEGIEPEQQKAVSYGDVSKKYGEPAPSIEEADLPKNSEMKRVLEWAKTRAGEYLSIEDGTIKQRLMGAVRKQLEGGIREGLSPDEIARRLFYIDPAVDLDLPYSNDTVEALNRDYRRVCFPAGTRVLTSRGPVPIEMVKAGDKVVTHSGKINEVVQQHRRVYSGGMTIVATKSGSVLKATDNHEVYVCRNGKMVWVPISTLVVGDKVVRARGWNTYRDPYWLRSQNHDLGRHCKDIAEECSVCPATIRSYMKRFHISVRCDLAFRGKKHTAEYKEKMRDLANRGSYGDRISTKDARDKADRTRADLRSRGALSAWNKGRRCPSISEGIQRSFREGRVTWSKGLTKETHPSLAASGQKVSRRLRSGSAEVQDQRRRQSETFAKRIAEGFSTFSSAKRGQLVNNSTGIPERYQSSWERAYMERCNENGTVYTRNHGIVISYVDDLGKERRYVPDFFEAENLKLVEIKPSRFVERNVESTCAKIKAAEKFCSEKGWDFIVLTEKELFGQPARV